MIKVDLIHGGWLNAPNGASSVIKSLRDNKKLFAENNINLETFTMDDVSPRLDDSFSSDVTITSLKGVFKKVLFNSAKYNSATAYLCVYSIFMRHAKSVVLHYMSSEKKINPDVIYIHDIFTCHYYLKYRKDETIPIILVLHNNGDTFNMIKQYYPILISSRYLKKLELIEENVISKVQKIGFVARQPLELFKRYHPDLSADKLFHVYNGIYQKEYQGKSFDKFQNVKYRMCCVGSISSRKGQDILLSAFAKLDAELKKDFHVIFVGDGTLRARLEQFVIANDLSDFVDFVGVSNNVDFYLSWANLFILPSRDEGFPISILEALQHGLAVFSTNIAGIPEMVYTDVNGVLFNPKVEEVYKVLNSIESYHLSDMGKASYILYKNKFTLNKMINGYSLVIQDLL